VLFPLWQSRCRKRRQGIADREGDTARERMSSEGGEREVHVMIGEEERERERERGQKTVAAERGKRG
jgi:hypothetical protein